MEEYKRIMLKLSGEALAGDGASPFDEKVCTDIAKQVKTLSEKNIQIGIVIGGGNFWRGRNTDKIDRTKADSIGMLATIMNCVYVSEIFRAEDLKTAILTPFVCGAFTELFSKDKANEYFADNAIVFFAGGTGHPYFSTDMGVALRSVEIEAECIFAAKSIDGVYDSDPEKNPNAKKYDELLMERIVDERLGVIDLSASVFCMENKMPMKIFGLNEKDSIINAISGNFTGTNIIV